MLYPHLEERLHTTRRSLAEATPENIIERCKQYLALLDEYRGELYKLPDALGVNLRAKSSSAEDVESLRGAIRVAIQDLTQEHNVTTRLLLSFTAVSGYEAVETFNSRKFKGHDNWQLGAGGVRYSDGIDAEKITIQEAVNAASRLRREEYVARQASGIESVWAK